MLPYPHSLVDAMIAVLLTAGVMASIITKKLTITGAIVAGVMGWMVFYTSGLTGLSMLCAFFILGTGATAWKRNEKKTTEPTTAGSGARTAGQVLANGGMALFMAILTFIDDQYSYILKMMLAASLASATADTLSSELGMVYGKRFFNCLTFKPDQKGLDGVISLEGTLIGAAGAAMIAAICIWGYYWTIGDFFIITICGISGNYFDSVLGVVLERKNRLNNDQVNFLSTLFAALLAGLIALIP